VHPAIVHRLFGDLIELLGFYPNIAQVPGHPGLAIRAAAASAARTPGRPSASLTQA
jgi:hypothetical protein